MSSVSHGLIPQFTGTSFQGTMSPNHPDNGPTSTMPDLQPDDTYYVEMDSVYFAVENTLFKVSKYPFIKGSSVFSTMFALPHGPELSGEGRTKDRPIVLPGATAVDFRVLLRTIHPLDCPPFEVPSFGIQERGSVLRLAKMWAFDAVVAMASSKLGNLLDNELHPIESVLLGREFRRADWLSRGYVTLISREDGLTDEEVARIGWTTATKIFRTRDRHARKPQKKAEDPVCCDGCGTDLTVDATQYVYCNECDDSREPRALWWNHFMRNVIPDSQPIVEELFAEELASLK